MNSSDLWDINISKYIRSYTIGLIDGKNCPKNMCGPRKSKGGGIFKWELIFMIKPLEGAS